MALYQCFLGGRKVAKQLIGTLTGSMVTRSGTIDVSKKLNNYKELTANNFIMELAGVNGGGENSTKGTSATTSLSYNPTNGVITCQGIGCCTSGAWNGGGATVNVYYLYID